MEIAVAVESWRVNLWAGGFGPERVMVLLDLLGLQALLLQA
jgi:hypothetical protein